MKDKKKGERAGLYKAARTLIVLIYAFTGNKSDVANCRSSSLPGTNKSSPIGRFIGGSLSTKGRNDVHEPTLQF